MMQYDHSFDPPAITLIITVAGVVYRRPLVELPALIDTGADISAVPESVVERLKLYPVGRLLLEDANAMKTPVFTYETHLAWNGEPLKKMEVVLTPYSFAILGRDWLRDYYLLLDGPNQLFQLSRDPLTMAGE